MSNFFPTGLKLDDTKTPMEILQDAQRDWEARSDGLLTLVLQTDKSESGNDMIIVHAKHLPSNRTSSLFSVVSRPGNPYPVTIQSKEDELPKFLRKSYYERGYRSFNAMMGTEERTVTNKWVSETPGEFRRKLEEVFNLGIVLSEVLNLVRGTPEAGSEEPDLGESQDQKD